MTVLLLSLAAAVQAPAPGIAVTNTVPPTVALPPQTLPPGGARSPVINAVGPPPLVQLVHPPRPRRTTQSLISRDDYPPAAMGTGAHGRVSMMLKLDTQGRVTECIITRSSGSAVLDLTTCRLVQRRARFDPATDQSGKPVIGFIAQSVEWPAR